MTKRIIILIALLLVIIGGTLFTVALVKAFKNNNKNFEIKEELIEEEINDIELETDTSHIYLLHSEDGKTKIEYTKKDKVKFEYNVTSGKLYIKQTNEKKWYDLFNFNTGLYVKIYLPKNSYNDLKIKCSTGDISLDKDFTFNSIEVNVSTGDINSNANVLNSFKVTGSTGDIKIDNSKIGNLNIDISTGKVEIKNSNELGDLYIHTSTGKVIFDSIKCNNLESVASTGKVNVIKTEVTNKIKIKTSTGDVTFDMSDANELDIETTTGDVTGSLCSDKTFKVTTSTGKVNTPPDTVGGICKIKTSTGDIKIEIKNN